MPATEAVPNESKLAALVVKLPAVNVSVPETSSAPPERVRPFVLIKLTLFAVLVGGTSKPVVYGNVPCAYNKFKIPVPKFQVG